MRSDAQVAPPGELVQRSVRTCTVILVAAALITCAGSASAQTQTEPFHVFLVVWRGETVVEHGFRAHLRERGIRVRYTLRNIAQDRSRIPEIVAEIRAAKPDLVHTFGTSATLGILGPHTGAEPGAHVEGIPGVFSIVAYPIEANIVPSFEATGRPVTGTAFLAPIDSQLDAILAYREIDMLGVIYNSLERNSVINVEELRAGTEARGIEFLAAPVPLDARAGRTPGAWASWSTTWQRAASTSSIWAPTPSLPSTAPRSPPSRPPAGCRCSPAPRRPSSALRQCSGW